MKQNNPELIMMKFGLTLIVLALAAATSASPTITTLPNGMEVVLIENHSNPVIASVVVVRTGLRNETVELNGATHFLEHLLFNGTETRTQKQLYDEMDFLGGYNNANTAHDRTTFQILLEKSNFEKGLEIQADMLFHSTLPPDKFEKEKGIVIEEIGKDEDSESYRVERFFDQVNYRDLPYQWPILGSRQSIRRLTRDQVYAYYKTYYVPNNMVALIMGDFNTQNMLKTVERLLGQEPPGTLPEHQTLRDNVLEQAQAAQSLFYLNQGEATAHHVRISLPAPTRSSPDYFPFLVLTRLLADRLDQDLKNEADLGVTETGIDPFLDRDFAALHLYLTLNPDQDYHPVLQKFHQFMLQFLAEDVLSDRLQSAVTSIRTEDVFNSERPHYYGMLKSEDLAQMGPYFLLDYQDQLTAVTALEVKHVAQKYLGPTYPVVAVYQAFPIQKEAAEEKSEKKVLRRQLSNGLLVVIEENQDSKVFAAHFLFKNRSAEEIALSGKPGLVDFLHHLLDFGPQDLGQEEFQARLQSLGTQVKFYDMAFIPYDDYYTTPEFSYLRLEGLDENYAAAFELMAATILQPNFTPPAIEATRGMMMGLAKRGQASVQEAGKALFKSLIYGDSPLAASISGSAETIKTLTAEDVQKFHQAYFAPNNLILTIVTSNPADSVMNLIEAKLGSWAPNQDLPVVQGSKPILPIQRQEKPGGKEQSYLGMGYTFDLLSPQDEAPLAILNAILSDRMQFQLREKEGLAYTLGSAVTFFPGWGLWAASMGTGPKNLARGEVGILEQLKKAARDKFTDHEVTKARNAFLGRQLMRGLSRISQAYLMGLGELHGQGAGQYMTWLAAIKGVTAPEVIRVARQYLRSENLTVAIIR